MDISVIIPVYNEGEPLWVLCNRIEATLINLQFTYETILVDDRSSDCTWDVMRQIANKYRSVKIVRLTRNFGQHNTLTAGLSLASGKYIVMMDCDQQDEPERIPDLLEELLKSDVQIVYARRIIRKDKLSKKYASILINRVMEKLSGYPYDPSIGTFRIMKRFVADSYLSMPEKRRFLGGMFYWLGFSSSVVNVDHKPRYHGKSTYNFNKQLQLARLGILSSSTRLLSLATYMGICTSALSAFFGCYYILLKLMYNIPIGYTSIIVSIFFVGGMVMFLLGIIGEYLREVFDEVKGRPNFIIEEKINFDGRE